MTTTTAGAEAPALRPATSPFAKSPVLLVSGLVALVLLLVSGRYGYFGDELYFVSAGHHLSFGYADQPPLVPLLALLMDTVAPGSLVALRVPAILATAAGVVVAALIARELGGDRRAQVLTAGAHALAFLTMATTLATPVLDVLMWTVLAWLVVRWVRTRADGLLLWAGVATAVALQVKYQVVAFWLVLAVAVLVFGPRELLTRPKLWLGALIAVATSVPALLWQAANGWPQLEMSAAVAAEVAVMGPLLNFALMFAGLGIGVGMVLGIYGAWRLMAAPDMRPYRFMAWVVVGVVVVFVAASGRSYYVSGAFPVLWAAGAVGFQRRRELKRAAGGRTWGWVAWPAYALAALATLNGLPLKPVESYANQPYDLMNFLYLGEIGWPQVAEDVAGVHRALPPEQQRTTVIITDDYWGASALAHYGPQHGLPTAYSGARGYYFFGRPPEDATTVIHVGVPTEPMRRYFSDIRQVATLDNGMNITTQHQGQPVFLATGPRAPWSRIWPEFLRINLMPGAS
ncbi:dolichyl-phosphate-mannose-protein mannosyltransferase [Saccharopolyspora erythraea NRRL 2338]|uniref:Glycosyl transferase, family 39 n=2 Tax=Saccharopolyspora erythraea TaxID=1836 RepID=A4FMK7_SACEN|nr:glycosyltransferase family 39 protein [Saccharopolyspora erythraea]EQD85527.1 glycosyl transferase [Saccharopolyspora erythraea D]PFG98930.1 dolichyl-phosphate-mannose-protein mannosyltransferase [Saccharopolyspora erythraea NRRL 2338]QRK88914.1 glycosyltransferase family 39 protein [Saccharopolyspora erythraea]CAM05282.1 glycosyl transferase, family 39 [Saccharopolyspora erythraea NRRL 2338]